MGMGAKLDRTVGNWRVYVNEADPDNPEALVTMDDPESGLKFSQLTPNRTRRHEATAAWLSTRYSRSPDDAPTIMSEIWEASVDADKKVAGVVNIGHKSPADAAVQLLHVDYIPMWLAYSTFLYGTMNAGQERSTRFQAEFENAQVAPLRLTFPKESWDDIKELESEFDSTAQLALGLHRESRSDTYRAFEEFYQPDLSGKRERDAFDARVFDTARGFLPLAGRTGMAYKDGSANWNRLIREMRGASNPVYHLLGDMSHDFLTMDDELEKALSVLAQAPKLIKYTDALPTVRQNVASLDLFLRTETDFFSGLSETSGAPREHEQSISLLDSKYTAGEKMTAQYILAANPGLDAASVFRAVSGMPDDIRVAVSSIIMEGHSHHVELPQLARTNDISVLMDTAIGENRDLNRHRAWGRFAVGLPTMYTPSMDVATLRSLAANGYVLPLYVTQVPEMQHLHTAFNERFARLYERIDKLLDVAQRTVGDDMDLSGLFGALPLAHRQTLVMHGNPQDAGYMTKLRVREGGHINYRDAAFDVAGLVSDSELLLSAWALSDRPDPGSREEFFSRK